MGFPLTIISNRGPQFAAQVTQELWRKLGIKQKLSTAFHPQTDGESERVNQEIEQYLRICGNFQQNDWAALLPIIEFAHNVRPHRSMRKSPFEVWYGFQPTFKPPLYLQTRLQSVDERIKYLEQVRKEVTAALLLAAQEMRRSGPTVESHAFRKDDLVLLEATNLQTTHPKAKLAPRRYGPFKVLWASPTNCKLELPPQMKIHPVFHNSLLKPYKETMAHGPNFTCPPPEIVGGKEGHYKIERILTSCPTRNRKSTQYLVKWKGYPDSENSWLPAKELQSAGELLKQFHNHQVRIVTTKQVLQAQWKPKEGILSQASPTPPYLKRGSHTKAPSPPDPTLKPSYSQVVKMKIPPHDPGAMARAPAMKGSRYREVPGSIPTKDNYLARDPGNLSCVSSRDPLLASAPRDQSHDPTRSRDPTRPRDQAHYGCATNLLIGVWKTVGKIHRSGIPQGIPHSLSPMDTGTGDMLSPV